MKSSRIVSLFLLIAVSFSSCFAAEAPRFVQKDGRWALLVDGQPFLMLGGQVHNSSAWPSEFPAIWKAFAALHAEDKPFGPQELLNGLMQNNPEIQAARFRIEAAPVRALYGK